jgi:hypothetical protein
MSDKTPLPRVYAATQQGRCDLRRVVETDGQVLVRNVSNGVA